MAADIYSLLVKAEKKKRGKRRAQMLSTMGVSEEYFEEGDIHINTITCDGVECKLCIKACPTNALYWADGEVKVEKDLCIYCCACVLSCIVDDCIHVTRKRNSGRVERFSTPKSAIWLCRNIASEKRRGVTENKVQAALSSPFLFTDETS